MQDMTETAKETTTTSDMAKKKGGKAARAISDVDITGDEASPDASRTAAPQEALLGKTEISGPVHAKSSPAY